METLPGTERQQIEDWKAMKTWPGAAKQQILVFDSYENMARHSETTNFDTGWL